MSVQKEYEEYVATSKWGKAETWRLCLKLASEAGEVADEIAKVENGAAIEDHIKENVLLELGDVLYFVTRIGNEAGFSLSDIMEANLIKLRYRDKYGKQVG